MNNNAKISLALLLFCLLGMNISLFFMVAKLEKEVQKQKMENIEHEAIICKILVHTKMIDISPKEETFTVESDGKSSVMYYKNRDPK